MMISMPFKLMLFVIVDGWSLIMGSMAGSFVIPYIKQHGLSFAVGNLGRQKFDGSMQTNF